MWAAVLKCKLERGKSGRLGTTMQSDVGLNDATTEPGATQMTLSRHANNTDQKFYFSDSQLVKSTH